jgi:hypothetical protein
MKISIKKKGVSGNGKPITDENKVKQIADKFRSKYTAENIARYYCKLDAMVELVGLYSIWPFLSTGFQS